MNSYAAQQRAYIEYTDRALNAYLSAPGIPALLARSMAYSVLSGGKRLRPCLTLVACDMLKGDLSCALPFACAIEMIHAYSLIHDDLPAMDDDDMRRNKPTNHIVFGEGQAVLAGDGLLSYAVEIMLQSIPQQNGWPYVQAARAIIEGAGVRGMVAGQCLDLANEGAVPPDEGLLMQIHHGKTAALIKAGLEAGACVAGANPQALKCIQEFGAQYGLLFQITDDILDVVGSKEAMGKTLGKDSAAGKLTFPSVYGLQGAKQHAAHAAQRAYAALEAFGADAWYLRALTESTLSRDH